jgi:hypothetical protein
MRSRLSLARVCKFAVVATAILVFVPLPFLFAADPGWPRIFKKGGKQLTVYQPQVDYWNDYTKLHFRCAIAVKGVLKEERFGVAEVDAVTVTDHEARTVAITPLKRDLRFANVTEPELMALRRAVEDLYPFGQVTTLSIERLLAYLDPATEPTQRSVELNLNPPKIFYSATPAILVIFMGDPEFKPVEPSRTDLLFAVNTNWDVLYVTANRQYYLLNGEGWLTAPDAVKGPWAPAKTLPPSLYSLPANDNWAEARKRLPGKPAKAAPAVFVTTEPAELILTKGEPAYVPVRGTRLLSVKNTASVLFLDTGDGKFYFLVAGRWFRGESLSGPWSAASADLPPDFTQIPDDDPVAFVKASVPGTREAKDAVLLASIPTTTTVDINNKTVVNVVYDGPPQFVPIQGTTVQYAPNSPNAVFLVSGSYYFCDQGVWFCGASASGPWTYCRSVPQAIYTIPPSSPVYNVTYVTVQSATPTTVVYAQTAGYSGEYVAATGVLMFGAGMLIGAAIANDNHHHHYYYPPYPSYYSYGCGARYHYGYGGYYSSGGRVYGPYGGAGYSASYNPSTGTYSRSSYAYGPYGSASRSATYNPYTGNYSRSGQVNTAYGSAGRSASFNASSGTYSASAYRKSGYGSASAGRSYNVQTGARAAGGQVSTPSGSAGRAAGYNPSTGKGAAGGYVSGQQGSAAGVKTSQGTGGAAWNTKQGQGAVGKTSSGDVYASNGDAVYKRNSDGGWSQNSGSGWQSMDKPQPQSASSRDESNSERQSGTGSAQQQRASGSATSSTAGSASSRQSQASTYQQQRSSGSGATSGSSWSQNRQSLESQAQSRSWGNQQSQRTNSFQSTASSGSGRSQGGGGRRR